MDKYVIAEYGIWFIMFFIKPTNSEMTVTAYDGSGIVQQQPLTLGCNYTKGDSDLMLFFNWKHEDITILSGSVSDQTVGFQDGTDWTGSGVFLGDFVSSLTIQLPASSVTPRAAGQYTCVVSSLTGGVLDTATATIYFTPQIASFPSSTTVAEFSNLKVNCSSFTIPGNPPKTTYTWTYGGSIISSGSDLDINNISRDRRGQYTCTASNTVGSSNANVTVDVQYTPQIEATFPSSRTVTEFSNLKVNCSSFTIPGNPPTTTYTWTYGGSIISSGSDLDINNIGRDKRGQYTCTASNTVGSSDANVTVDVQFAPQIEATFPSSRTVTEFSRLQIDCSSYTTPGNPPTTNYTWTYGGSTISSGSVLVINNTGRGRKGQYTCTVSNSFGTTNAYCKVDVQYLDRPSLNLGKTDVVENETISLTCNVESYPTAVLAIRNVDKGTVLVERQTNRLQFTIDRAQCLHNGTLLCTARNTQIGYRSTSARKELNVRCKPRIVNKQPPSSVVSHRLGEVASLTVYVVANPSPRFDWHVVDNKQLLPIPNTTEHDIFSSKQASILQIHLNNTREYGTYAVLVTNSIGKLQVTFTVSPDGEQNAPDDCLQTPDRLGLGVGIGISVMIPVIIVFISTWVLFHRRQARPSKNAESGTNELPMSQGSVAGEQRTYDDIARASSTVNGYEQLQIQEGSSTTYQNL